MVGPEFVPESEDTVRVGFGGVKVIVGAFEGSEVFNGEVFRKLFDRKAGKIVGHSMGLWRSMCRALICVGGVAD